MEISFICLYLLFVKVSKKNKHYVDEIKINSGTTA